MPHYGRSAHSIYPSRSGAGFADDAIAALADPAGAATPHAGLLRGRGGAFVVNREASSEFHLNILFAGFLRLDATLSMPR
jgi:hypothetical protein